MARQRAVIISRLVIRIKPGSQTGFEPKSIIEHQPGPNLAQKPRAFCCMWALVEARFMKPHCQNGYNQRARACRSKIGHRSNIGHYERLPICSVLSLKVFAWFFYLLVCVCCVAS